MNSCFSQEPFREAIEEMAVRFYLNLPSAGSLWKRLITTLAVACSFHNSEASKALLPEDIRSNTVSMEQAEMVLSEENWLVFITALIAYYDTTTLKAIKSKQ
jgi:hypothetical protein